MGTGIGILGILAVWGLRCSTQTNDVGSAHMTGTCSGYQDGNRVETSVALWHTPEEPRLEDAGLQVVRVKLRQDKMVNAARYT